MSNLYINRDKKQIYFEYIEKKDGFKSVDLYKKLLSRVNNFEAYKGISVENFKKEDFLDFFKSLNSASRRVLDTYKSTINSYICYLTGSDKFVTELNKVNLADCIDEKMESLQLITEPEYYDILNDKGNYQDKAVVVLLWNKIKGLNQLSEIINLKYDDLDYSNNIVNIIGENHRQVQITSYEMEVLKKAYYENTYIKIIKEKNGITNKRERSLKDGKYLIKPTFGRRNLNEYSNKCVYSTLENRLSDYFNLILNRKELTPLKIYKSSIYFSLIKEYGEPLKDKDLIEYVNKRNWKLSLSNAYREQNVMYSNMKRRGLILQKNENDDIFNIQWDVEDTEIENIIENMDIEESIENINLDDIDFIKKFSPNISIYENSILSNKLTDPFSEYLDNGGRNKVKESCELSEKARYHLGMCGEKIVSKLLFDKNKEFIQRLGLKEYEINHVDWYNKLYNKNDKNWEDKSKGKGHDIKIDTNEKSIYLEIKTSYSDAKFYDLTMNEVKANNNYIDDYYVIKILNLKFLKGDPNKIDIKIIRNPLGVLNNLNIIRSISINL